MHCVVAEKGPVTNAAKLDAQKKTKYSMGGPAVMRNCKCDKATAWNHEHHAGTGTQCTAANAND